MDEEFKKAYESLIPKDRLVVDVMVGLLVAKDKEIQDLQRKLFDVLSEVSGD
jgi:hypothetical protein